MLRSAAEHIGSERRLEAFVVDDGIGVADKERTEQSLPGNVSVNWVSPSRKNFGGLPLWGRMPITTYDKLTVGDVLPASVSRAIWLDCDILVLADLGELWDRPFMGAIVMAVQDSLVPFVSSRFGVSGYDELGIEPGAPYFNAGMMVIDLAAWRASDVSKRALDHLKNFGHRVFFWDQEALNAVLAGKWQRLDPLWNWSANLDRLSAGSNGNARKPDPDRIVHFNGNIKPWRVNAGRNLDIAYFRVVDETAWSGWRPRRSPRSSLLAWYGSSRFRRRVYPAEQIAVQLLRRFTQRIT